MKSFVIVHVLSCKTLSTVTNARDRYYQEASLAGCKEPGDLHLNRTKIHLREEHAFTVLSSVLVGGVMEERIVESRQDWKEVGVCSAVVEAVGAHFTLFNYSLII